ncbi:MAG: dTDP-glucose 4,6-dehydratase [Planctomycetaceae bacterium]|nr:MAG: dTDP-glucose 4,6-dehydratase [Planctomycetaceae bacterium]
MNILVTGGCGFIGSNFIRWVWLHQPQVHIVNLDKLTYAGNPENLSDLVEQDQTAPQPRYRFIQGDIADAALVRSVLLEHQFDAVINFAAESHVDRSILDASPFVQTNIVGTQTLMDACRAAEVPRFVQISTDEVYGSLGTTGCFTEETPLAPNSPYAASKAAADLLVRAYCHTYDFPGIITRCSNNYGPWQFPEKIIPLFITNALQDEPLPVYGTGQNVRDWIYVEDHCRGIWTALMQGRAGEVYNFGGSAELTNLALTHRLLDLLGKPHSLVKFVADRPGHDWRYAMDWTKAQRELGWSPQVSLEDGLQRTITWYQAHADWVARVKSGEYRRYYCQQYGGRLSLPTPS